MRARRIVKILAGVRSGLADVDKLNYRFLDLPGTRIRSWVDHMPSATDVLREFEMLGSAPTRKTFARHGALPTMCGVPDAVGYIQKMEARKAIGKKRKDARC